MIGRRELHRRQWASVVVISDSFFAFGDCGCYNLLFMVIGQGLEWRDYSHDSEGFTLSLSMVIGISFCLSCAIGSES